MGYHDCYVCGKDLGGYYQYHWSRKCHIDCHPDNVAKVDERERFKEIGRKEAQAEIARLQALLERREKLLTSCMMQRDSLQAEVERLSEGETRLSGLLNESALRWQRMVSTARNDALEEAAQVARDCYPDPQAEGDPGYIPNAIRALKDAP